MHHHAQNQLLAAVPAAYSDPTCNTTIVCYMLSVHGYLFIHCAVYRGQHLALCIFLLMNTTKKFSHTIIQLSHNHTVNAAIHITSIQPFPRFNLDIIFLYFSSFCLLVITHEQCDIELHKKL